MTTASTTMAIIGSEPSYTNANAQSLMEERSSIPINTSSSLLTSVRNVPTIPEIPPTSTSTSINDAIEILQTQRLACDNIGKVISNGDLNEASFKGIQLSSQVKMGGRILLETLQQGQPSRSRQTSTDLNLDMARYLQSFALLVDVCDDLNVQLEKALRGNLGVSAVAQIQLLASLEEVCSTFDVFLRSVEGVTPAGSGEVA